MTDSPAPPHLRPPLALALLRAVGAVAVTLGWTCALGALVVGGLTLGGVADVFPGVAMVGVAGLIGAGGLAVLAWRGRALPALAVARDALVLGALPAWGLVYSHAASTTCETVCGGDVYRPLAEPEVWGFLGLHLAVVLAYAVARRRPTLPTGVELGVQGALVAGVLMQILLIVHFGEYVALGVVFAPMLLPALSPVLAVALYGAALWPRLRGAAEPLRAGYAASGILGVYTALHALWLGQPAGALQVFTRTCDWTLSTLPVTTLPGDCHYLCTVAARGHPALVRPLRMGQRRGVPIVVNRQLALANAFEDLLHERWPRLGRVARTGYDRLARPICAYLRSPWVSDLVYLAMKPAEWAFYVALLLLDPGDPERRVEGMYR